MRPKKPASQITGHKQSKETLAKIAQLEKEFASQDSDIFCVPNDIKDDEVALQYYGYILQNMLASNIPVCNLDIPMLAEASICLSMILKLRTEIINNGATYWIIDGKDNEIEKVRDIVKLEADYVKRYQVVCNKLGLDPSSRASIAHAKITQKDNSNSNNDDDIY